MNSVLERPATAGDTVPGWGTPAEMVIDFERMVWTCAEHGEVVALDSGEDCPQCSNRYSTPVRETG